MRTLLAPRPLFPSSVHHSLPTDLPVHSFFLPPSSAPALSPLSHLATLLFSILPLYILPLYPLQPPRSRVLPDVDPFRPLYYGCVSPLLVIFQFPSLAPASFVLLLRRGGTFECQPPGRHRSVAFLSSPRGLICRNGMTHRDASKEKKATLAPLISRPFVE